MAIPKNSHPDYPHPATSQMFLSQLVGRQVILDPSITPGVWPVLPLAGQETFGDNASRFYIQARSTNWHHDDDDFIT
uniref:Uncharacterized protein n=1 Tax=Bracon brevicornis TaxID=1563983 RepID=A0A6V7JIR4_9HYME